MTGTSAFDTETERYERWFTRNDSAYRSELAVMHALLPEAGPTLEVGVGTGRFAALLGVEFGIDPSLAMLRYAAGRGVRVVGGIAEALPFRDATFASVLVVTTICFVDDARGMLSEARRVLTPDGSLVIGFIDRDSPLGRHYVANQAGNVFYRNARFFSAQELADLLQRAGFAPRQWLQTLTRSPDDTDVPETPSPGRGSGGFVGVRAT